MNNKGLTMAWICASLCQETLKNDQEGVPHLYYLTFVEL